MSPGFGLSVSIEPNRNTDLMTTSGSVILRSRRSIIERRLRSAVSLFICILRDHAIG